MDPTAVLLRLRHEYPAGRTCFFNFNCVVLDVCLVRSGTRFFGPAVQIYTPMHPLNAQQRRTQEFGKPVEIGSDVWVGGGAIICPGVRLARGRSSAQVAWSRATSPMGLAAGNPCRVIRRLEEQQEL